jgi:phenylpropionate dioxygenase-like ring-hydroxylating dioxygenase large terminal subunit
MTQRFPFGIPNGWFAIAFSDELTTGQVLPLHYFGRDLVLYRGESGTPRTVDAFCPHLGAHLGHGGIVTGDRIRCPFHAWEWEGETGECAAIPYAERIPAKARIGALPTVERNGFVFAWHHAEGKPPEWEVPAVREFGDPDWTDYEKHEWRIGAHQQELGENAADSAHFKSVHGTMNVPTTESEVDGVYRRALQPIRMKTPRGLVEGGIETEVHGMGLAVTRFTGIAETLEVACTTPVDAERCHVRMGFSQPRSEPAGSSAAMINEILRQMDQDIPIWENKQFRPKPLLCDGDGPIPEYRRWCQQFYSAPNDDGRRLT